MPTYEEIAAKKKKRLKICTHLANLLKSKKA